MCEQDDLALLTKQPPRGKSGTGFSALIHRGRETIPEPRLLQGTDRSVGVAATQLADLAELVAHPLAHRVATGTAACRALFPAALQAVVGKGRTGQHEQEGGHAHEGQWPCEEDE